MDLGKYSLQGHFSGQTVEKNGQKWREFGAESLMRRSPKGGVVRPNKWAAEKVS